MSMALSDNDPHSFSNPNEVVVTDINLNLEVDFKKQILTGFVDLNIERKDLKSDLILDANKLIIHGVKNKSNHNKIVDYVLGEPTELYGSKLVIKLPKRSASKKCVIRVEYETSPKASALSWLTEVQTSGKKYPFVFSQNQTIHARSMFPCQDTPSVKTPYTATISVPFELTALMSAIPDGEEMGEDPLMKNYKFVQKIPVPSYLIALAVGALESRKIGPRSHVWAEKEIIGKAAEEFSETEKFLTVAESICGEYIWGVYDLLVLPPFYAFGGTENPCITFVNPTLLAGDKSLVHIVSHEITHSWTGNLVTNKNHEHFWLNEGFTEFITRKILGRIFGDEFRLFYALTAWKQLVYDVEKYGEQHNLTKLVPDLKGVDADEACTFTPYEKGHALLFYLEKLLGGPEVFEEYLKAYIQEFKFKSIDTATWKTFLYKYFFHKEDILNKVDWDAWLHGPGYPPIIPDYNTSLNEKCQDLCQLWVKTDEGDLNVFSSQDVEDFSSLQMVEFLSLLLLKEPLGVTKLKKMFSLYKIGEKNNSEIKFRYIRLSLLSHWKEIIPKAIEFITEQGRVKFIMPIYKDLFDWKETRHIACSTYKENEEKYMYFARFLIKECLHQ